jgi:hypothetical protein
MPEQRDLFKKEWWVPWPDRESGPWALGFHWAEVKGRAECIGVEIFFGVLPNRSGKGPAFWTLPGREPEAIKSSAVREIPLATVIDDVRREVVKLYEVASERLDSFHERDGEPRSKAYAEELRSLAAKFEPTAGESGRGRPRQYGAEHFIEVARVYAEAWRKNRPPTTAVAKHFNVSPSAAAKQVARARDLGLLGETKKGTPGGVHQSGAKGRRRTK